MRFIDVITQRVSQRLMPEALERVKDIKVSDGDRVRIVFEFEIVKKPSQRGGNGIIKDAVEIRHRRPWS